MLVHRNRLVQQLPRLGIASLLPSCRTHPHKPFGDAGHDPLLLADIAVLGRQPIQRVVVAELPDHTAAGYQGRSATLGSDRTGAGEHRVQTLATFAGVAAAYHSGTRLAASSRASSSWPRSPSQSRAARKLSCSRSSRSSQGAGHAPPGAGGRPPPAPGRRRHADRAAG